MVGVAPQHSSAYIDRVVRSIQYVWSPTNSECDWRQLTDLSTIQHTLEEVWSFETKDVTSGWSR